MYVISEKVYHRTDYFDNGRISVLFEEQEVTVDNSDVVSISVTLTVAFDTITDSDKPFSDTLVELSRNLKIISKDDICSQ